MGVSRVEDVGRQVLGDGRWAMVVGRQYRMSGGFGQLGVWLRRGESRSGGGSSSIRKAENSSGFAENLNQ